jgi:hypothetical protein
MFIACIVDHISSVDGFLKVDYCKKLLLSASAKETNEG